jgi:hypothetical protein
MHRGRLLLVTAAACGALSLLLPFYRVDVIGDVSATSANGTRPLLALAGAALVAVAGDRGDSLTGVAAVATAAAVTLALTLTGALLVDAVVAGRDASLAGATGSVGPGLWLMVMATVIAIAGTLVGMSRRLS